MPDFKNPRLEAVYILTKILGEERSLGSVKFSNAFSQELVYGVLRWYEYLAAILNILLENPRKLKSADADIYMALLLGLYQLNYLDLPEYAAVNETVQCARDLKKPWASRLINGVLRNFLRTPSETWHEKIAAKNRAASVSHPQWLYEKIGKYWPAQASTIFEANNQRPPFSLRVNLQRAKRDDYLPCEIHQETPSGLTLEKAVNIQELSGFAEGKISVQDGAAQLAAYLLDLKCGQKILDACAAPGGKTAHMLETAPDLKNITALDIDAARLERVKESFVRLKLPLEKLKLIASDAACCENWWDGELFDRILLDAPCSATGVIRRHPDIKYLRKPNDISKLVSEQKKLLNALWELLKPGGLLLYATCSILPEENTEIIQDFLTAHQNIQEKIIDAQWGIAQPHGRQILPDIHSHLDGFYYCLLQK